MHAEKGTQERDSILRDEQYQWPNPGLWDWSIRLGPSARIAELKPCYGRIIALCEEAGVTSPRHLPWALRDTDPDVRWLIDHPGRDDEPDAGGIGPHPAEPCVGARRLLSRASTFSEGPVTDSGLGRVDLLFKLLTRLGLNTPDGLHPYLERLHGDLERRPLAEQIIDAPIAEDESSYEKYLAVRAETDVSRERPLSRKHRMAHRALRALGKA